MPICWYCHWGWPKPVAEIYKQALEKLNGYDSPLIFGPSHLVWADENFNYAEQCLEYCDRYTGDYDAELAIIRWSLEELIKLPVDLRCVKPEEYDGEHPELYPPPDGVEMVRI